MTEKTITSFTELNELCRDIFPGSFHGYHWTDGVIAIMGSSPADSMLYRGARDSCGDANTPAGYYTYYVVRDVDPTPEKMSDWSAIARNACSWNEFANAVRQLREGTFRG